VHVNWAGLWITFQAGFTESFIASSLVVSVAVTRGRQNAILGTVIGLVAAGILAFLLQLFLLRIPTAVLHWVSSGLLLAFGVYLVREFNHAQRAGEGRLDFHHDAQSRHWHAGAILIAAWGVFNEGLEILVVWLAITLHDGARTATLGAIAGIGLILLLAVLFRRVFRWIPPKYLDLIAGIALLGYGLWFAIQALG
jgi:uncharacterized membrane protein